jgi:hypothetical protein
MAEIPDLEEDYRLHLHFFIFNCLTEPWSYVRFMFENRRNR